MLSKEPDSYEAFIQECIEIVNKPVPTAWDILYTELLVLQECRGTTAVKRLRALATNYGITLTDTR